MSYYLMAAMLAFVSWIPPQRPYADPVTRACAVVVFGLGIAREIERGRQ